MHWTDYVGLFAIGWWSVEFLYWAISRGNLS